MASGENRNGVRVDMVVSLISISYYTFWYISAPVSSSVVF